MNWKRRGVILALATVLLIIAGLYFLSNLFKKDVDPWLLIPENSALIVEIDHPKVLFESISGKNKFWKSLKSIKEIEDLNEILGNFDSIDSKKFPILNELFNSPFLLSLQPQKDSSKMSYLISIPNNHLSKGDNLNDWIGQILNNSFEFEQSTKLENALFIKRSGSENGAYVIVQDNVLLITSDFKLLEKIINQEKIETYHFSNSNQFQKLKQTAGKNVDARFFINYHFIQKYFSSFLNNNSSKSLDWMENFAGWSVLDLLVKNNELLFNGYTDLNNSKQFLAKYSNDVPVINQVYSMLPYNTTFLLNYSTDNFINKTEQEIIAELTQKTKINIEAFLASLGNEICLASSAKNNSSVSENSWCIAHLKDKAEAIYYLDQLVKNSQSTDNVKYKSFTYKRIDNDNFLSQLFNFPFQPITTNWYTIAGDYIVFANSPSALTNYFTSIESGRTLDLNENFTDFSNKFSSSSNLTVLIRPNSLNALIDYLLDKSVTQSEGFLKTFSSSINMMSFQFSAGEPYFYTSFSVSHSESFKEQKPYLWNYQFDADISSKPFLLRNSASNQDNIIVVDELFTMYCISIDGKLLWQTRLDSPVLGDFHEIQSKNQLLFNTKDYIYLINRNGDIADGFPIQISPSATNGLTLYSNSVEYRLVIAQSDKIIHNYNIEGKPVKGWGLPEMDNIVKEQITYIKSKNKDFLTIIDDEEKVQIVNKYGSPIINKKQIDKGLFSNFYANKTNGKGDILTTNKEGKLTYISEKGKIQYTDFGNFRPEHYFIYEDFNGDNVIDFIYIDGNKLKVLDRFKKTLFSYNFNSEINTKPVFYRIDNKQIILAVEVKEENSIYFFNNKGEAIIFPDFPENALFELCIEENKELNLVISSANSIYLYRLK